MATLWFVACIDFGCSHDTRSGPCFQIRNTRQVHATVYFFLRLTESGWQTKNRCMKILLELAIFCGLREQMFAVRDDWNFGWEIMFPVLCSSSREAAHLIYFFFHFQLSHISLYYILETCHCNTLLTDQFIDASVNRPCKHFLSEKCQGWYAGKVEKKIKAGQNIIDMGIPVMREVTSRWLIDFYQYTQKNPAIIGNRMWHLRRPSKWCSVRWPIRANLMYWIVVHLTFSVLYILFCWRYRLPHVSKLGLF